VSSTEPTIEHLPFPGSYLCVEGDPTQWGLAARDIAGLTAGEPVALEVITPLAGTLLLAPGRAGSLSVYPSPLLPGGWFPCVELPAPHLYLPSTTGVAAQSPGYMLAPGTNLETLQQDILTAMHDGTFLPVSATIDGHAGTVLLNGAALPFVVLVAAEPTTQRSS
jgi:hypothetical protein